MQRYLPHKPRREDAAKLPEAFRSAAPSVEATIRGYTCPMASAREERLALNEALFRAANERMGDWEERHRIDATELYFCECADPECRRKVSLHEADYERVRSNSEHFVVVPGHEVVDIETVIESHEAWVLVEKAPEIREIVEATDPRTD
jgi:hypothetical protein